MVSDGRSKLCHTTPGDEPLWIWRLEVLRSTTRSPAAPADQRTLLAARSVSTRSPSKEREARANHCAGRSGMARQSGNEDGRWSTARSSMVAFTRRNPRAKTPAGSDSTGSNCEFDPSCAAEKPRRSSCTATAAASAATPPKEASTTHSTAKHLPPMASCSTLLPLTKTLLFGLGLLPTSGQPEEEEEQLRVPEELYLYRTRQWAPMAGGLGSGGGQEEQEKPKS
uniref:Uncharacterized protein n=1 Tax=Oryza brachyantha TaxID=4533 RepID=J3LDE5_ORYBR